MKRFIYSFAFFIIAVNSYSQILWHHVNGTNGARVNCIAENSNGDIFETFYALPEVIL